MSLSRASLRRLVSVAIVGWGLVPTVAAAQVGAPADEAPALAAPATGADGSAPAAAEATAEPQLVAVEPPAPVAEAAPPTATPPESPPEKPAEAPVAPKTDDDVGEGTSVATLDAWFGLEPSQAKLNGVDYKGLGGALGLRGCLLCLLLGGSRVTGGDLIGFDTGIGYQTEESDALGHAWALLRIDLGLQIAARPVHDFEVVLRYYVISHLNTIREVGASDDVYVLEPGIRYRQFLVDVGFAAKLFAFPLLADHGDTASAFTLRGRYLLDMKRGYYAGVSYERMVSPASEQADYRSNVFRLMLGVQN